MPKEENVIVNRNYKDSIFRLLFAESKENALSLYNAVNKTNYTNADELVFKNLEDAFYVSIKNDMAFVFSKSLSLYEHQSTLNRNMPLRGLFYFGAMYRGMVEVSELYQERMVKIPTPKFVVFYNGAREIAGDVMKLKLSDMFETPDESGEFEWTATLVNINQGHSEELMKYCITLNGYAIFIEKIRKYYESYAETMPLEAAKRRAVERAVKECIEENVLKEFLEKHRKEVLELSMFEFSEEDYQKLYIDKGRAEGIVEGKAEILKAMIRDGYPKEEVLKFCSEEEYEAAKAEMLELV